MSPEELEEWQDKVTDLQINFDHGLVLLTVLAGRNPATVRREEMLEFFVDHYASCNPHERVARRLRATTRIRSRRRVTRSARSFDLYEVIVERRPAAHVGHRL